MVRMENDAFLEALKKLFQINRAEGSVVLTMKRYDGRTKPKPSTGEASSSPSEFMCLVRAYCSKSDKNKISTVIHQKEAVKFQMAYSNLLKTSIDGLKKTRKAKKTKA
ncbi:signal recognition particle 14 kDa protein [Planococcus citri]|uniref:signal recognition particle 14 kDa protein n=1 Tax=Planococcus citri TaxID=170843 RepID=UPI0031F7E212